MLPDPWTQLWITYFGLCALFAAKGAAGTALRPAASWALLLGVGVPLSWWSLLAGNDANEGFYGGGGIRVVRESGKPCLLREKGITYRGCYYSDVGGCAIPEEGLRGDCPATFSEFQRKHGVAAGTPATAAAAPSEECSGDAWEKIVSLRDDEMDALLAKGGNHPLAACVARKPQMARRMRERFLAELETSDNTQDVCARVRRDELRASNRIARQMFRDVYQECFRDVEPAAGEAGGVATARGEPGARVQTSGFVLMDEPEMLTIDKNGRESDDVLRRHMRQEFVSKCQRFVSQKTPEQVQAFVELGEKVENLEWWRNVSLMVERTADEIRKAQLLSGGRTALPQLN